MRLPKPARPLLALVALQACIIFVGPTDHDDEVRDLARARARWNVNGIPDYDVIARAHCFCAFGGDDVRVIVRSGGVVSATILATGRMLGGAEAVQYRSVEQLFDVIENAIDLDAYRIDATYDAHYGYPTHFFIDYQRSAADEEFGYEIVQFTPR